MELEETIIAGNFESYREVRHIFKPLQEVELCARNMSARGVKLLVDGHAHVYSVGLARVRGKRARRGREMQELRAQMHKMFGEWATGAAKKSRSVEETQVYGGEFGTPLY